MKIRTTACLTLILSVSALSIQASTSFSELDVNNDGYISQAEATFNNELSAVFAKLDKNDDMQLSQQEFAAFKGQQKDE